MQTDTNSLQNTQFLFLIDTLFAIFEAFISHFVRLFQGFIAFEDCNSLAKHHFWLFISSEVQRNFQAIISLRSSEMCAFDLLRCTVEGVISPAAIRLVIARFGTAAYLIVSNINNSNAFPLVYS
jgi:hypothetical protein